MVHCGEYNNYKGLKFVCICYNCHPMSISQQSASSFWKVTQMRVSIFPKSQFEGKADDLWPKVEGLVQETSFIRAQNNQSVVQGCYKDTSVNILVVPFRIDLSLT